MRCWCLALLLMAGEASADSFVIVSRKADLYAAPEAGAQTFRTDGKLPEHARWRFVAERGDFVEVESVPETLTRVAFEGGERGYCVLGEDRLERLRLRLFVRKADLLPVLVRPFEKRYADGTAERLLPGVPIEADERKLGIPAAAIGTRFAAAPTATPRGRDVDNLTGRIGGKPATFLHATVTNVEAVGHGALVTVASECGETVIKIKDAGALRYDEDEGGIGGIEPEGPMLRAGTPVLLGDERVGALRHDTPLGALRATRAADGRYCWDVAWTPALHLCVNPPSVPAPRTL